MSDPKSPSQTAEDQNDRVIASGAASLSQKNNGQSGKSFNVYRYPSDLGGDKYPHYLMFFITVRESDLSETEKKTNVSDLQFDTSQNNTGVDKSTRSAIAFSGATGAVATAKIGSSIGSALGGEAAATVGAVTGAVFGVPIAIEAMKSVGGTENGKDQVTIKDAIALYMSGKPSVQYKASWADEEIGIVGGLSERIGQIKSAADLLSMDTLKNTLGAGMASYVLSQSMAAGNFGGLGNAGAAMSAASGVTPNPFRAQLFKSMGFRTFSYEYVFLPKNVTEYHEAQQIIKTFKIYMHPTLGPGKFVLNYPAEFTIAYYYKDDRNKELYKISNCALTDLSVEYGGTDFTTFKGTKGYPTEIGMKLQFTELEVLSRERIEAGY